MEFTTEATDVAVIPTYEGVGFSVLTGYWGGQVRLFDLSNGQMVKKFESHGFGINKVSFAPNNRYVLAAGSDFSANIWSLVTGEFVKTLDCSGASARNLLFTTDETWAALECDGTINIWDSKLRASDLSTPGHFLAKLPPDNRIIALTPLSEQGDFWIKSVPEGEILFNFSLSKENAYIQFSDIAFSPDGTLFALGAGNGMAYIWNVHEKNPKYSLAGHEWTCFEGGCSGVNDVAFDPYGKLLASAGFDKTVRLWDVNSGKQIAVLKGFADSVSSVTFSPDGRYLVVGCHDGKVYVWSME